jgi:periplasmic copper chaperone A
MTRFTFALLVAACIAGAAFAHDYDLKTLHIDHPFTRATPPGGQVAGAFMSIENRGKDADRLISVTSPVAGLAQIHEMAMEGGLMKMRAVPGIELKPGSTVQLRPGGYHVMLEALKQPLKQGDEFPLTLTFEKAGSIEIKVAVEAMGAAMHPH